MFWLQLSSNFLDFASTFKQIFWATFWEISRIIGKTLCRLKRQFYHWKANTLFSVLFLFFSTDIWLSRLKIMPTVQLALVGVLLLPCFCYALQDPRRRPFLGPARDSLPLMRAPYFGNTYVSETPRSCFISQLVYSRICLQQSVLVNSWKWKTGFDWIIPRLNFGDAAWQEN